MAFANQARIDVAGIYNRFSSLERRAIDGEKCHLSTSTRGPIFYMETPDAWSRACFRARMSPKDGFAGTVKGFTAKLAKNRHYTY